MIIPYQKDNKPSYFLIPRPSIEFIRQYLGLGCSGVEIGVYRGEHAQEIMSTIQPNKLFLVDTWNYMGDKDTLPCNQEDLRIAKQIVGSFPNIIFIEKTSKDASNDFIDGLFDFIYIDAEHSYESVKQDLISWMPKVKNGGVIAGHDIRVDGVKKAVSEITQNFFFMGDDWWFIKSPMMPADQVILKPS